MQYRDVRWSLVVGMVVGCAPNTLVRVEPGSPPVISWVEEDWVSVQGLRVFRCPYGCDGACLAPMWEVESTGSGCRSEPFVYGETDGLDEVLGAVPLSRDEFYRFDLVQGDAVCSGGSSISGAGPLSICVTGVETDPDQCPGDETSCRDVSCPVTDIALGSTGGCAVLESGRVACWGDQDTFPATIEGPTRVPSLCNVSSVAVGNNHACAVGAGGVWCWGSNTQGQRGTDNPTPEPNRVEGIEGAVSVTAGNWHTCALLDTGRVTCWGSNQGGALGRGSDVRYSSQPEDVGLSGVAMVAAGPSRSCAVDEVGSLFCWGSNWQGRLGDGTTADRLVPTPIDLPSEVSSVSIGDTHSCLISSAGHLFCWGDNASGQLGIVSESEPVLTPQQVDLGRALVAEVGVGAGFSCVRTQEGSVSCWGSNWRGSLGVGGEPEELCPHIQRAPIPLIGLESRRPILEDPIVDRLEVGQDFACILPAEEEVHCWGSNQNWQLGRRSPTEYACSGSPVFVPGLSLDSGRLMRLPVGGE